MSRRKKKRKKAAFIVCSVFWLCTMIYGVAKTVITYPSFLNESAYTFFETVFQSWMGGATYVREGQSYENQNLVNAIASKVMEDIPSVQSADTQTDYETDTESQLTYEMILASEANDENHIAEDGTLVESAATVATEASKTQSAPTVSADVLMEKLNDFDYLLQTFYVVDSTTTIDSSRLNVQEMLAKDMTVNMEGSEPKILIYHTHSLEAYADSVGTDSSQTVVGLGNTLADILQNQYGVAVYHDTTSYDAESRDYAYSNAEPGIQAILAQYPDIEVVIDLHRDGVAESTHLVTEVDGKPTAQIMFFNGLSYTTANGDITYLPNPYIEDNLAFSFQMQLTAAEYYPGFSRCIYLKGYRYNMHFKPKSLLVEVGAQTNTLEEAYNAMPILADILYKVLSGEAP